MRRFGQLLGLVAVMTLVWILVTPPSAGPDEPSHAVRGAALVRGMLDGERVTDESTFRAFELPATIGFPDPGCYAFQRNVPASCATSTNAPPGDAVLFTRSADYPIWGHLAPGVGSLLPRSTHGWALRVADALVPVLLVAGALLVASRRSVTFVGATLLAVTPTAWFTFAVVNPSGPVIAGGLGLWVALVALTTGQEPARRERLERWVLAASWTAMVLPRRDGLVYAALILAIMVVVADVDARELARRVGRSAGTVIGIATLVTLAWASRSDTNASLALFAAPLAPLAAWGGRALAHRLARRTRSWLVWSPATVLVGVVGVAGVFAVMSSRADGFDRAVLRTAIGESGEDLTEAIGILGWLDAPVPTWAIYLWVVALGLLVGVALLVGSVRLPASAVAVVVIGLVTSWTLTMVQNDAAGTYWQGRYYLPLLVGVPVLLGSIRVAGSSDRRVGIVVAALGLIVTNVAAAAAVRRFAVGVDGSLVPTDWNTYDSVLPPVVLLGVHVVASIALLGWLRRTPLPASLPSDPHGVVLVESGVNVVGYHHVASGLGRIAREIVASLEAAGVPCAPVDVVATSSPEIRPAAGVPATLYSTTIAVVTAPQLPGAMAALPEVVASQDRLIGYWFWELATVPDEHRYAIDLVDAIWTPTRFVHDAYAAASGPDGPPVSLVPTRLVAPAIDRSLVEGWRTAFEGAFMFVVSLDLLSVVERKNPFGAIEAFRRAFDPESRHVRLVVKTINGDKRVDDLQRIVDAAGDDDRITVLDRHVSSAELDALIAAADVYVSLHRSEGLGLHLADAMCVGTPVIATRWSGNLDFMDDDSAALVDAALVPVVNGQGAYPATAVWAEPDLDQAASWMRRLVDDPDAGRRLAVVARRRMEAQPERRDVGHAMIDAARAADHVGARGGTVNPWV